MSPREFLWLSEAEVCDLMDIGDAIRAVESGLRAEASGSASNMEKTHVSWPDGTLHAIGAVSGNFAGTKTWAYTTGGATPLLVVYDSANGALQAVIEARALGQIRTAAMSGVATRALALENAGEMAIFGTGRQALPQVAGVAAVRPIKRVRVWGRTPGHAHDVAAAIRRELGLDAHVESDVAAAAAVPIITTATRSRQPFLTAAMVARSTHINAIGAIIPTGAELSRDLVERCERIVADSVAQSRKLARELIEVFGDDDAAWGKVQSLSDALAAPRPRSTSAITLFKSLGIGIADLAIGTELIRLARERGAGRMLPHPVKAEPRLRAGSAPSAPVRTYAFVDRSGAREPKHHPASPVVITREAIAAEVERLAALPRPENGRRTSQIVNPAAGVGKGLAPGTAVSLFVLKPGERTRPIRQNVSLVSFCLGGRGTSIIGGQRIRFEQYDVWNTPPWSVYEHINDSDEVQIRLTYSNAPLLEKLNVHIIEEDPATSVSEKSNGDADAEENPFGTLALTADGAQLMPYEKLIHPDVVPMKALHWPWKKVKEQLDKLAALGSAYRGRRLYLLYNPATGRTNGTSHTFFATMCLRPANIVDRPHRHTASAINYFFKGSGSSVIEGKRYAWKAGDLMLTAPGWAIHHHSSHDEDVYELTIQDSPLQIAMGSLLWQEDLQKPPEVLGTTGGFKTNRRLQGAGR